MDRVGIGQDSHKFSKVKKPLVLGGVKLADLGGFDGNSDSDIVLHSLCNAISSALGGDSLSTWSDDMCRRGISDSRKYVEEIYDVLLSKKYKVSNVAVSLEGKKPYVSLDDAQKMKGEIARLLKIEKGQVGITFTSGENLTPFGKGLGMQATCVVLISK